MTASGIEIRDTAPDDIGQIADIWRHYVSNSIANFEETPPTTLEIGQDFEKIFSKGYPCIVAVEGDAVCGYAYFGPFNERSGYRFCCEDSVYLLPGHAGKGLGKRLLQTLIEKLGPNSDLTQVLAKIAIHPEATLEDVPSCRLHLSRGFREVGRLKKVGKKFGEWLDVVIMQLDLESKRASEGGHVE